MQTTEDQKSMSDIFVKSPILRPGRFKILCCETICIRNHCVNGNIRDILFNFEVYAVYTVDQQLCRKQFYLTFRGIILVYGALRS